MCRGMIKTCTIFLLASTAIPSAWKIRKYINCKKKKEETEIAAKRVASTAA